MAIKFKPTDLKAMSIIYVEGIELWMPKVLIRYWPVLPINEFPNFCGPGSGISEKLIPDTMFFLSVRHVCFIHDMMFTLLPPITENWHLANSIMLINNLNTIRERSNPILRIPRSFRALHYYGFVELNRIGFGCFTNREYLEYYIPEKDPRFIELLNMVGMHI